MISYTRIKTGEWGLRISDEPATPGAQVVVTKKSGEAKTETIGKVVWSSIDGTALSICTIAQATTSGGPTKDRKGYGCDCSDCHGRCPRCRCDSHCVCKGGNIYDC